MVLIAVFALQIRSNSAWQAGELRQKLRVMEGVLMTLTAAEARELRKEVRPRGETAPHHSEPVGPSLKPCATRDSEGEVIGDAAKKSQLPFSLLNPSEVVRNVGFTECDSGAATRACCPREVQATKPRVEALQKKADTLR